MCEHRSFLSLELSRTKMALWERPRRQKKEHGAVQPHRCSAQRLSYAHTPPTSAAGSPEKHRTRRGGGWICLGACLVVAWGAPADTAHPLTPPRAHDWRAPRHVPSHPPPWQKGPGLRRMVGAAGRSRFFLQFCPLPAHEHPPRSAHADSSHCCAETPARFEPGDTSSHVDIPAAKQPSRLTEHPRATADGEQDVRHALPHT